MIEEKRHKIGERLKEFRKFIGKNQKSFSKDLHITQSYLSSIERGEKNLTEKIIIAILDIYNKLNLNWLFTGKGDMFLSYQELVDDNLEVINQKLLKENSELKSKLITFLEQPTEV